MRGACQQVEIGNRGVGGWRGIGEGGIYIYSRPAKSRDGGGLADFRRIFAPDRLALSESIYFLEAYLEAFGYPLDFLV